MSNEELLFELKMKIARAMMFGLNVDDFVRQLLQIMRETGDKTKSDVISEFYYKRKHNNNNTLSVSMIIKDEEELLEDTLMNVSEIADEIIIIDTGSTDKSKYIASRFTNKIWDFPWQDDYSLARNFSLDKCSSAWVLYLDADEQLTDASKKIIKNLISKVDDNTGLLITKILNKAIDEKGNLYDYIGQYPRLFRNIGFPLLHFFGKIHEQIAPSLINFGFDMQNSGIEIIHSGYAISPAEMNDKVKRNLDTLVKHVQQDSQNAYTWYQLGNTLYQMQEFKQCIDLLENALRCKNLTPFLSSNSALAIADSYHKIGNKNRAIEYCQKSIEFNPKNTVAEILLHHIDV